MWERLWDDIGMSPAGQPRAALSTKRLKKLGEVGRQKIYFFFLLMFQFYRLLKETFN